MSGRQSFSRVISSRAADAPDEPVVVEVGDHGERSLTARDLDLESNALAREYLAMGATRDDLVMVSLPNGIEFVVTCAAIWKAGATPMPLAPTMGGAERAELEQLARPALAVGTHPVDRSIPWCPAGVRTRAVSTPLPDYWAASWKAPTSSGSTGRPKIVTAAAPALIDPDAPVAPFLPRRAVQLVTAPLWHSAAFTYAFRGLLTGHRLVLTGGFDEHRFCELVDRYRVTWTLLSPGNIGRLVRMPQQPPPDSLESVLHLGAPCATADKRALIDWLGPERVVEVYAGSESNGLTMITGTESLVKPGSVGKPIGGTEIRILTADGATARTGEIGQIWMRRGPQPAYRYLGAASRRTADGWDTLGDVGMLDADGYLTVVDRAADVIATAGQTVYPSRVEHVLQAHPDVRGAVVYGCGTGVGAVIEVGGTAAGGHADAAVAESVRAFARTRLTPAELPHRIDTTRSPLRNHAGKVRRSTFRSACDCADSPESAQTA